MNLLIICLLIAAILPYLSKIPLAFAMSKTGSYDNNHPRIQQAELKGFGARALAAHQNSFESLLIFSIGVLSALATQQTSISIQSLAVLHIIARILYHVLYLLDLASFRTFVWGIGTLSSLIIIGLCIR